MYVTGGTVQIETLQTVPLSACDTAEIEAIAQYRALGCDLTNHTDGGGGILNADAETRAKIGAVSRGNTHWAGKTHTPEARAKISAAHRGQSMHPNTRAALELARRTRPPSTKAKPQVTLSESELRERRRQNGLRNKCRTRTQAWCQQRAAYARLHCHSADTKQRMGAWQRGDNSHRAKLTWDQVKTIRYRHATGTISQHQLAREYRVQPRTINLIVHHKTWVAV